MQHMLVTLVTLVHHLLSLQWLRLSDTDDHSDAQVTLLMLSKHPQLKKKKNFAVRKAAKVRRVPASRRSGVHRKLLYFGLLGPATQKWVWSGQIASTSPKEGITTVTWPV